VLAVALGLQSQRLHQPYHAFASTTHPTRLQGGMNTWAPINLAILQENRVNFGSKPGIFSLVLADGSFARGVIATH
jgi:hypothetical protein